MKAELFFEGKTEEFELPDNTVFVNYVLRWSKGYKFNVIGADVSTIESSFGCSSVRITLREPPGDLMIHAYVDKSGELSRIINTVFSGMELLRVEENGCRFSVTV